MNDLRYIFAEPIELENIGTLYPLNIMEFIKNQNLFSVLSVTKTLLLQRVDVKDTEQREFIEKNVTNFEVATSQHDLINSLIDLFALCFGIEDIDKNKKIKVIHNQETKDLYFRINYIPIEQYIQNWINKNNVEYNEKYSMDDKLWDKKIMELYEEWDKIGKIDKNNYDYVRNNIIKINNIRLPKQAKTLELQKWFDKAQKVKTQNNNIDFEDIITTIHVLAGIPYKELRQETVYQINKTIARINKVKEFETNVQYICVGATDVKLESFLEHIDDEKEETYSRDFNEVHGNLSKILKN